MKGATEDCCVVSMRGGAIPRIFKLPSMSSGVLKNRCLVIWRSVNIPGAGCVGHEGANECELLTLLG